MTDHAIMRLQAEFARTASHQRTEAHLRLLRENSDRASRLDRAWTSRAAAHAEFHCLLADATGGSAYSLLARLISGSVRDMITRAGPGAGDLITAVHRRLTRHLEDRDADSAAREMERFWALLSQRKPTAVS
jgi:GntR family transcriptional repressor for pyruvate dehydrogenase complex